jgi:hypothetical protein
MVFETTVSAVPPQGHARFYWDLIPIISCVRTLLSGLVVSPLVTLAVIVCRNIPWALRCGNLVSFNNNLVRDFCLHYVILFVCHVFHPFLSCCLYMCPYQDSNLALFLRRES